MSDAALQIRAGEEDRRPAADTLRWIPAFAGMSGWRKMVFHVYILASGRNGTLYIGMTDDLNRRVWEHQTEVRRGFTKRYCVHRLVWSEQHASRETAFARERAMKKWNRAWKIDLIEGANPQWRDLAVVSRDVV